MNAAEERPSFIFDLEVTTVGVPEGYMVKRHWSEGWWVSGNGGYLVAGYFEERAEAVAHANYLIEQAEAKNINTIWRVRPAN